MTIKDLYRVIIKVFGLYLTVSAVAYFLPLIASIKYDSNNLPLALALLIPFFFLIGFIVFLLFRTEKVIDRLKLTSGHSTEKLQVSSIYEIVIIKLAIVIISLYLFVTSFPSLCYQSYSFFSTSKNEYSGLFESLEIAIYFNFHEFVISLINIIIAYLMFSNYDIISKFLLNKIVEKDTLTIDDKL